MSSIDFEMLAPLFQFNYTGDIDIEKICFENYESDVLTQPEDYSFSDPNITLKSFKIYKDYPKEDNDFFSNFEKSQLEECNWCISIKENIGNHDHYSQMLNLLLLSFRVNYNTNCFIKYKLCPNLSKYDIKLHEYYFASTSVDSVFSIFRKGDIEIVDTTFCGIVKLYKTSFRTKTSLGFMYLGFTQRYGMAALPLLIIALESFYLPVKHTGIISTLKERVTKFINDSQIANAEIIDEIYKLRSDIIHGKVKTDLSLKELLPKLDMIRNILLMTLKKIIDKNLINIYKDEEHKENYFNTLDS